MAETDANAQVQPEAQTETVGSQRVWLAAATEFKPKSDQAKGGGRECRPHLAEQAPTAYDADIQGRAQVHRIDDRRHRPQVERTDQSDHAPSGFPGTGGAWRGLHYLIFNTETDEMLKIRVMNISKRS